MEENPPHGYASNASRNPNYNTATILFAITTLFIISGFILPVATFHPDKVDPGTSWVYNNKIADASPGTFVLASDDNNFTTAEILSGFGIILVILSAAFAGFLANKAKTQRISWGMPVLLFVLAGLPLIVFLYPGLGDPGFDNAFSPSFGAWLYEIGLLVAFVATYYSRKSTELMPY